MDVSEIQTVEHDVLVIGAGGAGLRASIECSALGLNTGVLSKSLLGKARSRPDLVRKNWVRLDALIATSAATCDAGWYPR